jgi:hypothetical protein
VSVRLTAGLAPVIGSSSTAPQLDPRQVQTVERGPFGFSEFLSTERTVVLPVQDSVSASSGRLSVRRRSGTLAATHRGPLAQIRDLAALGRAATANPGTYRVLEGWPDQAAGIVT